MGCWFWIQTFDDHCTFTVAEIGFFSCPCLNEVLQLTHLLARLMVQDGQPVPCVTDKELEYCSFNFQSACLHIGHNDPDAQAHRWCVSCANAQNDAGSACFRVRNLHMDF